KENRDVPPLDYARVYRLKAARPQLTVVINGGIASLEAAAAHLRHVDGAMLGRAAYREPWRLLAVESVLFGAAATAPSRRAGLELLMPYIERELARGTRLHAVPRHVLGLFNGMPGARAFRRHLACYATGPGAGVEVIAEALSFLSADVPAFAVAAA